MLLYQYATVRILRLREKYQGPSSEKLDVFAWVADGGGSRSLFEVRGRTPGSRLDFLGIMGASGWDLVHVETEKALFNADTYGLNGDASGTVSWRYTFKRPSPRPDEETSFQNADRWAASRAASVEAVP